LLAAALKIWGGGVGGVQQQAMGQQGYV